MNGKACDILDGFVLVNAGTQNRHASLGRLSLWALALGSSIEAMAAEAPSALHLVREGQNVSQLRILKMARERCFAEKHMLVETQRTKPQLWAILQADMQKNRKGYDIGRPVSPEPDWSRVALRRVEEYFQGEKYAQYVRSVSYKLSDDGACTLLAEKTMNAEIDDGQHHYDLDFIKGTNLKRASPVLLHRQLPPSPHPEGESVVGHEYVVGERCEYLSSTKGSAAEICYWSVMHRYPGVMQRPVVLKMVVKMGNDINTEQAIQFSSAHQMAAETFQPPKNMQ